MAAVRATMSEIIDQLRILINDVSEEPVFSDLEIQTFCDLHKNAIDYESIKPIQNITTTGVVEYKKFTLGHHWFEKDLAFTTGSFATLTPTTVNYQSGEITFTTSQNLPILMVGTWYNIYLIAAEIWSVKAAMAAEAVDFSDLNTSFSLSQKHQQCLLMEQKYKKMAGIESGTGGLVSLRLVRTDVAE